MEISIYQLQTGKYQASYFDPVLNRRKRAKFKYFNDAKAFKKNILAQFKTANPETKSSTPIRELVRLYQEKNPKAPMFARSPDAFASFASQFGSMPVGEINKMHLSQWLEKIQKEKDYSPSTLLHLKYCFTPFFDFLCSLRVIDKNPMSQVRLNRYGHRRTERIYFSENEFIEVLDKLKSASPEEIYPVSYFLAHTAVHLGEALKLTWDRVDFEKSTASFPATGSANDRTLSLPIKLVEFLKSLPRNNEFVFTRADKKPWSVVSYYRRFSKIRAKIGFKKHFDSYAFRHTFAYHFIRKGGTMSQLQAILGHRGIDMTNEMYGEIIPKNIEKTTPYDF